MRLLLLVACISLFQVACLVDAEEEGSLYLYQDNADPVKEYTGTANDFTTSANPRVVEFYSPHCPVCIAFKPEYVQLARSMQKEYSSSVDFYAVSCDAQPKKCEELDINTIPSIYVYLEGSSEGKKIEKDDESTLYTVDLLARELDLKQEPSQVRSSRRMDDNPGFGEKEESEGADDDRKQDGGNEEGEEMTVDGDGDEPTDYDETTPGDEAGGDPTEPDDEKDEEEREETDEANGAMDDDKDAEKEGEKGDEKDGEEDDDAPAPGDEGEIADSPDGNEEGENADSKDDDGRRDGDEEEPTDGLNVDAENDITDGDKEGGESNSEDFDSTATESPPVEGSGDADAAESGDDNRRPVFPDQGRYQGPGRMPQLGGASLQRPHDAGHHRARNGPKALDRFKVDQQIKREEYAKKREGIGKWIRPDNRKDEKGNFKTRLDANALTKGMKAFTPGTIEHQQHFEAMKKRMQKAHKKMRIPPEITAETPLKKDTLPYRKDVRKRGFVKKTASHIPLFGKPFRMTPEEELISDVSVAFVTGLESGVKYRNGGGLDEKQSKALRNYLDLLNISLPPEWGIHKLIDQLRRRFAYIIQSRDNLKRILDQNPVPRRYRTRLCAFPCAFWKLLHVVTVGVADQRGGLSLVETGLLGPQTKLFSPIDAADTIRDYMDQFFNCDPCRRNFVQNYDSCDNNRRCDRLTEEIEEASIADWKELPVWLWEVHNEVSVRLLKERKEKAKRLGSDGLAGGRSPHSEEIAAIWPNIDTCFLCFNDDGTWDEAEVFKHLESTYWPDSELDPLSERLIHYEEDGSLGLGLFLWVFMFGILWVVYSTIGKTSPTSFRQGFYQAKRFVSVGPRAKKDRSN